MHFPPKVTVLLLLCIVSLPLLWAQKQSVPGRSGAEPCTNPDNPACPANIPPTCNYIANDDYSYGFQRTTLAAEVGPAIVQHLRIHNASYPTYKLPITFLWDSLGIGDLMKDPNLPCCGRDVSFTRSARSPDYATFQWSGAPFDVPSQSNPILMGYQLKIHIGSKLTGWTVVAAGVSEFHFDEGARPHLQITDPSGKIPFDLDLQCLKASVTSVVARPASGPGTQALPVLVIHP